ncbi:MAG: hypothetical protein KC613_25095 [Myxococcales bacterium]|nr:hypothetical protein [Myxococcales bacterium]MCB9524581.1 hypothetical protein [Myxococcales bacterium]
MRRRGGCGPALLGCALALLGCGEADDPCVGAAIEPSRAAVDLGDRLARDPGGAGDVLDTARVPVRKTLLLKNTCGTPLTLRQVCLINDQHNGVPGDHAFAVEGPDRAVVGPGDVAGVRITYDHADVNADLDMDAVRDPDRAVLVVQSDAANAPTLVVPVCGRILPAGETADPYACPPPFTVPAGQRLDDLCDR